MNFQGIVIHHSASRDSDHLDVDQIEHWHLARGFSDIGYHWIVEGYGVDLDDTGYLALMGRPMFQEGAHAKGYNRDYVGVCLVGNFSQYEPPIRQLEVAADLCAGLLKAIEWPNRRSNGVLKGWLERCIRYHGELPGAATECPGTKFPKDVFRQMVGARLK